MIRRATLLGAALWAAPASGSDETTEEEPDEAADEGLAPYRTPFEVLADRAIGTTSTPVEFNWRTSPVMVGATGTFLLELNNFNSARVGALARIPSGGIVLELGVSYVDAWDTPSSELLALTPYRQPGRPDRMEVDLAVALPLAEGVVTVAPRWFPAAQLVFNLYGGVRYLVYPHGFGHMSVREVAGAVFSPTLTDIELVNLDDDRLDAMQIDSARYGLMFGFGNDIYSKHGLFLSPRLTFAVPLLAPATETDLLFFVDLSLAVGVAF